MLVDLVPAEVNDQLRKLQQPLPALPPAPTSSLLEQRAPRESYQPGFVVCLGHAPMFADSVRSRYRAPRDGKLLEQPELPPDRVLDGDPERSLPGDDRVEIGLNPLPDPRFVGPHPRLDYHADARLGRLATCLAGTDVNPPVPAPAPRALGVDRRKRAVASPVDGQGTLAQSLAALRLTGPHPGVATTPYA